MKTDTECSGPVVPASVLPSRPIEALLVAAHEGITEAELTVLEAPGDWRGNGRAGQRYVFAHLAALRAAAAVLAARARPGMGKSRPISVWVLLAQVAPEFEEWARFFAAGAAKRAAAEAGISHAVSRREADDLLRDAQTFLTLVETALHGRSQTAFPFVSIDAVTPGHSASSSMSSRGSP